VTLASSSSGADAIRFVPFETGNDEQRAAVLDLTHEYFGWMDAEISGLCGFSIPDIVGMELGDYVVATTETMCASQPPDGAFYLVEYHGEAAGMGGLRRLPDGAAEIVRIYTRPAFRGLGIGASTITKLVDEARRFGYHRLKLDTGVFMTSAHRIYAAAGFTFTDPYEGAEPPAVLHPFWLFMHTELDG
jgi:GNAT superfamily N-acetyltransferase